MVLAEKTSTLDIIKQFSELGDQILKKWSQFDYTEEALASVSAEILDDACLYRNISMFDILNIAMSQDSSLSAHQVDSTFGDLQQIVYRHSRFYIEVLYWSEGTTAIHDHAFSGAFCLLQGSSVNVEYSFHEPEKINHHFWLGRLASNVVERLDRGAIKPIYSGQKLIHSVFHLEGPTITVVVRTYQDDDAMPQFEYRGNKIRLVLDFPVELSKKVQALRFMRSLNYQGFVLNLKRIFTASPLDERYWLYRAFYTQICQDAELLRFFEDFDNERVHIISRAIREEAVFHKVINMRASVGDTDARYFLALMLNIPSWTELLRYFEQYHSGDDSIGVGHYINKIELQGLSGFDTSNALKVGGRGLSAAYSQDSVTDKNALSKLFEIRAALKS